MGDVTLPRKRVRGETIAERLPDPVAKEILPARHNLGHANLSLIVAEAHVRIQAAFQAGVDGAVSKTINLPHDATHEDIADTFRLAAELGCKGLTVYRAGSREEQALEVDESDEDDRYDPRNDGVSDV